MTYVVTENCIKCKYMDCVEVCPVDCFYEGENMLVIHPDECIDCGVCEPECPAEAIKPDAEPGLEQWLKLNADMAKSWPNITRRRMRPPTRRNSTASRANSRPTSRPIPARETKSQDAGDQGPGFGETRAPFTLCVEIFLLFRPDCDRVRKCRRLRPSRAPSSQTGGSHNEAKIRVL